MTNQNKNPDKDNNNSKNNLSEAAHTLRSQGSSQEEKMILINNQQLIQESKTLIPIYLYFNIQLIIYKEKDMSVSLYI